MHWDTFKQDNYSTVGGGGGCRVGEVRAGTTSPVPDNKGFKLSNCQRSTHSISKVIENEAMLMSTAQYLLYICCNNSLQQAKKYTPNHYLVWCGLDKLTCMCLIVLYIL